jgi:hypothetical protein
MRVEAAVAGARQCAAIRFQLSAVGVALARVRACVQVVGPSGPRSPSRSLRPGGRALRVRACARVR